MLAKQTANESLIVAPTLSYDMVKLADGTKTKRPEGWALLEPVDATLTRRVKAAGPSCTVQQKKGRKTFSHGVWAPAETIDAERARRASVVGLGRWLFAARPFIFDDRPYQRVETTTSVMPQDRYEAMLLERAHARRRWENQPAVDLSLEHLDHEEILRTRETAISQRRISAGTPMDVAGILDRLGLRRDGVITQAAQILYGTRFLPDYPQGLLKMGRFRGTKITGDILDNRQEHLHAFAIVREGMAFLDRTLPLSATFPEGRIERQDRLAVPPAALREALLNAVMHRDYSDPSSYIAIAIFDDRVEIRSVGSLPRGVTLDALRGEHRSVPRNPLIAETFHRTGAVEIWGRGTNRIAEECERYGLELPTFEDVGGAVVVTFRAEIGPVGQHGLRPESGPSRDQVGTKSGPSRDQVDILRLAVDPKPIQELMDLAGRTNRSKFRDQLLRPLLDDGLLEMTIPDKPTSSRQRYRTTPAGKKLVGTAQ